MEQTFALLIPLAGIAMIISIVYLGVTADNRRDMAMIEAGMNPKENKGGKRRNLRNGLLLIFIPIGLFVGNYVSGHELDRFFNTGAIAGAFLFGGIALLIFHFIERKAEAQEGNN
ncbi:MAG: DUF6249 domain-containing protein [Vicingaceae bacterium]